MQSQTVYLSVGRDYRSATRYEFVVYRGEDIIARDGGFKTSTQAKRAGVKAAQPHLEA